jgi:hypothetical protein
MKFYGIIGPAIKVMESYLRIRYQRVAINANNNLNGYGWKKNQLDATVYMFILADGDALHVSGVFAHRQERYNTNSEA